MMKTASTLLGLGLAAIALPASAQDAAKPVDRSQDRAWHQAQQQALASLDPKEGWQWLDGGLAWRRIEGDGSGMRPEVSDTVTVHYAGTFTDGSTFDSSFDRGEPATFPLSRLIKAWQMAIPQAGVGDTIELVAPATLAYGFDGKGPIPGGATLRFKVKLIAVS